jgi:hypothetical protein
LLEVVRRHPESNLVFAQKGTYHVQTGGRSLARDNSERAALGYEHENNSGRKLHGIWLLRWLKGNYELFVVNCQPV